MCDVIKTCKYKVFFIDILYKNKKTCLPIDSLQRIWRDVGTWKQMFPWCWWTYVSIFHQSHYIFKLLWLCFAIYYVLNQLTLTEVYPNAGSIVSAGDVHTTLARRFRNPVIYWKCTCDLGMTLMERPRLRGPNSFEPTCASPRHYASYLRNVYDVLMNTEIFLENIVIPEGDDVQLYAAIPWEFPNIYFIMIRCLQLVKNLQYFKIEYYLVLEISLQQLKKCEW